MNREGRQRVVKDLIDDAHRTLEEALSISRNAQKLLVNTKYQITNRRPHMEQLVRFLFKALNQQHDLLNEIIEAIKYNVQADIIGDFDHRFESEMTPVMNALDDIIHKLAETKVLPQLVRPRSKRRNEKGKEYGRKEEKTNLCDFISLEEIRILKENIHIYELNTKKLHGLLNTQLKETILDPFNNVISKKFNSILKNYESLLQMKFNPKQMEKNSIFQVNNPTDAILKENASLEYEIVSILEMITNHYDQCNKYYEMLKDSTVDGDSFNFKVLENDAEELPDVLKEIKNVYETILSNEKRAMKIVTSEVGQIELLISRIEELLAIYGNFKNEGLTKFQILLQSCKELFSKCSIPVNEGSSPLEAYVETISQLTFHYTQFYNIFRTYYLQEYYRERYEYPRKFLEALDTILNSEMLQMYNNEQNRRVEWLAKYGDFIPKELILPGVQDQPAIVQVITEGLDDFNNNLTGSNTEETEEEKNMIKYIKSFNRTSSS